MRCETLIVDLGCSSEKCPIQGHYQSIVQKLFSSLLVRISRSCVRSQSLSTQLNREQGKILNQFNNYDIKQKLPQRMGAFDVKHPSPYMCKAYIYKDQ